MRRRDHGATRRRTGHSRREPAVPRHEHHARKQRRHTCKVPDARAARLTTPEVFPAADGAEVLVAISNVSKRIWRDLALNEAPDCEGKARGTGTTARGTARQCQPTLSTRLFRILGPWRSSADDLQRKRSAAVRVRRKIRRIPWTAVSALP